VFGYGISEWRRIQLCCIAGLLMRKFNKVFKTLAAIAIVYGALYGLFSLPQGGPARENPNRITIPCAERGPEAENVCVTPEAEAESKRESAR
jgi:hypothetical protein